jgi:DNA-directed RNA polymerase subunit alpha
MSRWLANKKKIVLSFLTKKNENNLFLHCIDSRLEENGTWFSRFHLGPLYIGSRLQIGTRLRRTLLNDLNQTSITAIKLDGVKHEFSRISGTHESTLDLLFQFRKVALNAPYMKIGENIVVPFFFYGPGIFYAKDISWPKGILCRNPEISLATLSPGAIVRGRLLVKKNLGLKQNSKDLVSLGKTSPFESAISKKNDSKIPIFPWLRLGYPIRLVKRVGFRIESLEPINRQNEVLIIEVFTNGSISPREALNEASLLLTYKFSLITHLIIPTLNKNQYLIGKKISRNYSSKTFQNKVKKLIKTKKKYQNEEEWVIENLFNNLLKQTINETITNDNSFNDISNNHYVYQLLNQYIECRTSDFSGHDLHIKLSKTDGSDEYLTGYLGKKDNKVYFIGDRNDIRYDISSLLLESTTTNTFPINTLLNMSLYNYGFETKLKLC